MDPFLIFLTVVITLLSVVIIVAGIQVILILRNINKTLNKANAALESAQFFFHNITHPLNDVKALGNGVKTGLYVAEHIAKWLKDRSESSYDA
jgi:hypothetical protein